jgi:hypothetical protein
MRGLVRLLVAVAATVTAAAAVAAWSAGSSGSGAARALLLGTGATPTAVVSGTITKTVTLSWTASPGATGYVVKRYDSLGTPQTVGGTCAGTGGVVTGTTCQDTGLLPLQSLQYTLTPAAGAWRGTEGVARSVST